MKISSIYVANGYAKSDKSYSENSRIKDVEVSTENGSFAASLADMKSEIKLLLPSHLAGKKTRWVKLTIRSVYPGARFHDTALNEFRPDLEEHNYEQ
jgi:hypothetical protein